MGDLTIKVPFDKDTLRMILAAPEGREALKALLTEDAVLEAAQVGGQIRRSPFNARAALAAAVDALDSPEGDT